MYDELFEKVDIKNYEFPSSISEFSEMKDIITNYIEKYFNIADDKETWFAKIKELSDLLGYASDMKAYKLNPENFKGNVGDVSSVIRAAITGRLNTPDLYEIMNVLGEERVKSRFQSFITRKV
jgi:glutamyl-tRNA synthetase